MNADYAGHIAGSRIQVAEHEGELAGFVVFYPELHEMHVENIAVMPQKAGQRVGSCLLSYVETEAVAKGLSAVNLYTNEVMVQNIKWYQRLGYQETERRQDNGFNRVFFRKALPV